MPKRGVPLLRRWVAGGTCFALSATGLAAPSRPPPDPSAIVDVRGDAVAAPDRYISARSLMHFLRASLARDAGDSATAVEQLKLATIYDPQSPYPQYVLAQEHLRLGQLAQAESAVRAALAVDANHEPSLVLLGRITYQRGRVEESFDAFAKAMALEPTDAEPYEWLVDERLAHNELGEATKLSEKLAALIAGVRDPVKLRRLQTRVAAVTERVASALEAHGELGKAEDLYWRAANQEPDRASHFVALGRFYDRTGRLRDGADAYARAFSVAHDDPSLAIEAAKLYLRVGDHKSALTCAQTVAAQATGSDDTTRRCADALVTIGNLLFSEEAVPEAEQAFALASVSVPDWSIPLYREGEALERRGKLAEAASIYRKVPGGDPLFISAQAKAALCEHRRGKHAQGIVMLRALAKAYPDNPEVASALALALENDGNTKGALALLEALPLSKATPGVAHLMARLGPKCDHAAQALKVLQASVVRYPDDAALGFELVEALETAGQHDEAVTQARRLTALSTPFGAAFDFLARALLKQGGHANDEAAEYAHRAVTGWPERGSYLLTLGMVQLSRGNPDAPVTLRRAADMLPTSAEAQLWLGEAELKAGHRAEAAAAYEHAVTLADAVHDATTRDRARHELALLSGSAATP